MPPTKKIGPLDYVALSCEIWMLILLLAAGHGLVEGWQGWALGVILAGFVVMVWSQWMSPNSEQRLDNPKRLIMEIAMFVITAFYAAAGGLLWWGIAFAVAATATFVLNPD